MRNNGRTTGLVLANENSNVRTLKWSQVADWTHLKKPVNTDAGEKKSIRERGNGHRILPFRFNSTGGTGSS